MWIQLLKTTSCRCIQQNYTVLEIVVLHFIFTHIYYLQNNLLRMQGRQQQRNCWCAQRTCHGPLAREPTALMKRDRTTNMQCRC